MKKVRFNSFIPKQKMQRLLTYFPSHLTTYGIGHAALSIIEAMRSNDIDCLLVLPSIDAKVKSNCVKTLLPSFLMRGIYKFFSQKVIRKTSEFIFLFLIKPNDIVYVWPGSSLSFVRKIKNKGNIIIVENINCHQKISKKILDDEAMRVGLKSVHAITQSSIEVETEILKLCDYVFSPSPAVTQSLLDSGVNEDKILASSYGLHDDQQYDVGKQKEETDPVTFIFVGRVGMRKGVHLLIEYWKSASLENAILKIVGNIENSIRDLIESYMQADNIQFIDFVMDIDQVYKEADVFILPSLEEGSPLVTYLALGAGLPCIVSPMGGDGVVTHNEDGFVIDPHDKLAWVEALQRLANSSELRLAQSLSARKNSDNFLWKHVGRHRANLLLEKLKRK